MVLRCCLISMQVEDFAAEHSVAFLPKPGRTERGLQVTPSANAALQCVTLCLVSLSVTSHPPHCPKDVRVCFRCLCRPVGTAPFDTPLMLPLLRRCGALVGSASRWTIRLSWCGPRSGIVGHLCP